MEADGHALASALSAELYDDLRAVAARLMRHEGAAHTLQATALVHEVWLRFVAEDRPPVSECEVRQAFARVVRRVLVDHARSRLADKRGGGRERVLLSESVRITSAGPLDVLELEELLQRLAAHDPLGERLVELRVYGGLTRHEAAEVLGISVHRLDREQKVVQAWLAREQARLRRP